MGRNLFCKIPCLSLLLGWQSIDGNVEYNAVVECKTRLTHLRGKRILNWDESLPGVALTLFKRRG